MLGGVYSQSLIIHEGLAPSVAGLKIGRFVCCRWNYRRDVKGGLKDERIGRTTRCYATGAGTHWPTVPAVISAGSVSPLS